MSSTARTASHRLELAPWPPELARGLCTSSATPHWWGSNRPTERAQAFALCQACAVRELCLEWSLTLPRAGGALIFGGRTSTERLALRRERRAAVR